MRRLTIAVVALGAVVWAFAIAGFGRVTGWF